MLDAQHDWFVSSLDDANCKIFGYVEFHEKDGANNVIGFDQIGQSKTHLGTPQFVRSGLHAHGQSSNPARRSIDRFGPPT